MPGALNALYPEILQRIVHPKILKRYGGELEHSLRSRFIEIFSTEEYINALEDMVTRIKIGRTWKKLDIEIPNKPFIKNDKPREPFKPNNTKEQRKCHKFGGVGHLANDFCKKAKLNKFFEAGNFNDKEEESSSLKDTSESETSKSDEINIINVQINIIDLIYEVLDVNSTLPHIGTSDTCLTNIPDAKLHRTKSSKGMGFTSGKSSISIVMLKNQEDGVNLDPVEYCTCVGKNYLETLVPDRGTQLIPIQGVEFGNASQSMIPLGIIYLTLIIPHPFHCIKMKMEFVVLENCTSNHFMIAKNYLSIYGIYISNKKDRYFTIGDNKRDKFGLFIYKKQITVMKYEGKPQRNTYP
ncbi:hypothetical protein O181_028268 [Austropuccinia psidii MF-1]|uniref:Uncharacterized protein n=1 Tax=Austropuccinia psidii MF-1 TaxID=1389203 RepID=A0A9Q3CR71_9BASI|nr:hypothetical protein [Austropuccinia psidii MF-1]